MVADKTITSYKDLIVWQKSVAFVSVLYRATANFPAAEQYGLTSQIRRAGVSIPANIAEGSGRGTRKDYAHFIHISCGSVSEVETLLHIAHNLEYIDAVHYRELASQLEEIARMLRVLRRKLRQDAL